MRGAKILSVVLIGLVCFSLGWMLSPTVEPIAELVTEASEEAVTNTPNQPSLVVDGTLPEQASPHDWIAEEDIHIGATGFSVDVANPQWAKFTNTNSMDPFIDENSHAIQIFPQSTDDIHVGDVVSYEHPYAPNAVLIHRVIEVGDDGEWYAILKGDNNTQADPGKVRFDQIRRVLVAVIY